ncbi:type II toxin-antitoxin system RelE/ParE family toxin [Coleofasciculus sp. H7-2]|uniref:type II toxin-antitoxin system RelE/ParE family toxin n=1 Tax=Coleofasciculus sp. H7-2 TaxID=3351545 RepID=UPI003670AD5E
MSKFYILTAPAKQDIDNIISFLFSRNPGAAEGFLDQIEEKFQNIANFPNMGRRRDDLNPPLRSFPIDNYLIFYRPIENGIEVVRVISGYRDIDTVFSRNEDN